MGPLKSIWTFLCQVLRRYEEFKDAARIKRHKLEESRRFHYFRRDADELELWIHEKLQAASEESYKDPTNLQAKIQKHQAFEAEVNMIFKVNCNYLRTEIKIFNWWSLQVLAHSNAIVSIDNVGNEMLMESHFQSDAIQDKLIELHRLWDLLFRKLAEKGMKLQQALVWKQTKIFFINSMHFHSKFEFVSRFWFNSCAKLMRSCSGSMKRFLLSLLMNLAMTSSMWKCYKGSLMSSKRTWPLRFVW